MRGPGGAPPEAEEIADIEVLLVGVVFSAPVAESVLRSCSVSIASMALASSGSGGPAPLGQRKWASNLESSGSWTIGAGWSRLDCLLGLPAAAWPSFGPPSSAEPLPRSCSRKTASSANRSWHRKEVINTAKHTAKCRERKSWCNSPAAQLG